MAVAAAVRQGEARTLAIARRRQRAAAFCLRLQLNLDAAVLHLRSLHGHHWVSLAVAATNDLARFDAAVHEELDDCVRSEEHTSELQSLMRISYAVFCLK